jgi:hypothetical protein
MVMFPLAKVMKGEDASSEQYHQRLVHVVPDEELGKNDADVTEETNSNAASLLGPDSSEMSVSEQNSEQKPEKQDWLFQVVSSGMLTSWLPLYVPPAVVCVVWLFVVFLFPLTEWHGGSVTAFTAQMALYFAAYIGLDFLLRFALSLCTYQVLLRQGFTSEEIESMAGPELVIPVEKFLKMGGGWLYQVNSYGRKIPHVLHWAGLAAWVKHATHTPWQAFQFTVMGATTATLVELCCLKCTDPRLNVLVWLSVVRTGDGYARRMNKIYTNMSSSIGMGCSVPLCAYLLSQWCGGEAFTAFFQICTLPCAYGDCMAEIVGVWGKLRFKVYGLGEVNNKSVEGMAAMFLGSFIPCLPFADAVGGWPGLLWVAGLATIAETWSPRGCDNIFIPVFSAIGAFIALAIHGAGQ